MLAGDAPAGGDARLHYLRHRLVHALALRRIVGAVGDVRVQVAVTGVEDVADDDAVLLADGVDALEDLRETRARNNSILHDKVGSKPSHGAKSFLSALPELEALHIVARDLDVPRAALETDSLHFGDVGIHSSLEAIELDEEYRFGIARVPGGVDRILDHPNGGAVHELQSSGNDSRCDDRGRDPGSFVDGHEISEQGSHRLRPGHELHRDIEREPEAALRTDERAPQIVAIALTDGAAELHHFAARQEHRQRQHVVERDAVLEAVRPAGVLGHVSADGAGSFARGVRRVEQSVGRDVLIQPEIHHSGLDLRAPVLDVQGDDLLQPVQPDHDDVVGQSTARQTRAGPTRHEREFGIGEHSYDRYRLVARAGENRHPGLPSISRKAVRIVDQQLARPAEHVSLTYDVGQPLPDNSLLHSGNLAIHHFAAAGTTRRRASRSSR